MPGQQVTDVRNDPRYWEQLLTHVNPSYRAQAAHNLARIQSEARQRQQNAQFHEQLGAHERDRAETRAAREQTGREHMDETRYKQDQLDAYRKDKMTEHSAEVAGRRNLDVLNLAQSPALLTSFGKQAPAIQKALMEQFFASTQGGGIAGGGPVAGATTLAALAGASAQDPGKAAVRNAIAAQGEKVRPETAQSRTNAPAGVPQRDNTQGAPQGGGGIAPGEFVADAPPVGPPGTAQLDRIQQLAAAGQPYVEGGTVHNQPAGTAGMDFNTNTGEWVPKDLVGTINGKPATQVIADAALKRGVSPEDTRSRQVYNQTLDARNLAQGRGTTPAMDIPIPQPPELPGVQGEPQTAAAPTGGGIRGFASKYLSPPGTDVGALFGGGGAAPIVQQSAPAPAQATNKPFFGSPELANQSTTGGAPKPPGPQVNIDVDKFLREHVGGPTMEALRNRQVSSGAIPPPVVQPDWTTGAGQLPPPQKGLGMPSVEAPPTQGPEYAQVRMANEVRNPNLQPNLPNPAPNENMLPKFNPEQEAALEAQRRAEEEARRRAAERAAAGTREA